MNILVNNNKKLEKHEKYIINLFTEEMSLFHIEKHSIF